MSIHLSVVYTGNVRISTSVRVLFQKKMNASDACAQCKSKHHNKRKKKILFFFQILVLVPICLESIY